MTVTPENDKTSHPTKQRWLLGILVFFLIALCLVGTLAFRYLIQPQPLPELLSVPGAKLNYPPHYLFSIEGVMNPLGVGVSLDGTRIYVSEASGERLVKIFDRDGSWFGNFSPPGTSKLERTPLYVAVDGQGRVFVSDRLQYAIFIYDRDGNYLDSQVAPDLSLNKYVSSNINIVPSGTSSYYNTYQGLVHYTIPGQPDQVLDPPRLDPRWSPVGLRFDQQGLLWITDVGSDTRVVRQLSAAQGQGFQQTGLGFGAVGRGVGDLLYPNVAVADRDGRVYISDSNNGRISIWNAQGQYLRQITGDGLNLPRGLWIDQAQRLHVVDAVAQKVLVYDIAKDPPAFLFSFGEYGAEEGLFNYPNDICIDAGGRLYITDRANNRVQVWSY